MSQEPEDALTAAYRRASEADAGQPAATTRQAIFAQAAAAASVRRRAPAANDAHYWPRLVAGIAVLGVGVLLWKQWDHRLPGDAAEVILAPPTTEAEAERARESVPETAPEAASERTAESMPADKQVEAQSPAMTARAAPNSPAPDATVIPPAAPPPTPPAPTLAQAQAQQAQAAAPDPFPASPPVAEGATRPSEAQAGATAPAAPPPVTAPAAPPLLARDQAEDTDTELSEVVTSGTRAQAPGSVVAAAPRGEQGPPRAGGAGGARGGGGAGAGAAARAGGVGGGGSPQRQASTQGVDRAALLRQYFPVQYQSDVPHSLWLVQNAAGAVELSGELAPDQRLEDLTPQILRTLGERAPGPWEVATVFNARGQPITLAIARVP